MAAHGRVVGCVEGCGGHRRAAFGGVGQQTTQVRDDSAVGGGESDVDRFGGIGPEFGARPRIGIVGQPFGDPDARGAMGDECMMTSTEGTVPLDPGQGADREPFVAATDLGAAFDEHDPEAVVCGEAVGEERLVARFEDVQGQGHPGDEHRPERKHRGHRHLRNATRIASPGMADTRIDVQNLLSELTLDEKAALCSGAGFWHTRAIERLGVPSLAVADGPHGLRVQTDGGDHLGIESSEPATCFPPAVTLGSTWDVDLARQVGTAIGTEARSCGLDVVLGPGVNIKRSPLCGRNFEYFSEDPHVAATMGTAWVQGLQSTGVGASLKHFAANNQETDRLRVSAEVDERTLREIYLAAFEPIVRRAAPATVMCAYNRINGVYAAQDPWLLTEVLRDEWGFDGLVVSDWGAVDDPVASVRAGLDLEMPSTGGMSAALLVAAVNQGELDETHLDRAITKLCALIERSPRSSDPDVAVDTDAHHRLARTVAGEGAVLLRNTGNVLPLQPTGGARIALIGALASTPRYQGAGSSQVNPTRLDDALGALRAAVPDGVVVDYAAGYVLGGTDVDSVDEPTALVAEAVELARDADAVVVCCGLPPEAESEGFDRSDLGLPPAQLRLIEALAELRGDVVVVLANGGVVTVGDFAPSVAAVLECWLGGQASGSAVADVLLGVVNPSGKLTETIPERLADTSAFLHFPGSERRVSYGEGLFVGYRHYDTTGSSVAYPFGFGLSYTTFAYAEPTVEVLGAAGDDQDAPALAIGATITNTGSVPGAEVVQVYVGNPAAPVPRPAHELRAFTKVRLDAGAAERVTFILTRRDLARWSTTVHDWVFDPGVYTVAIAASSRDLRLVETVDVPGPIPVEPLDERSTLAEWLAHPVGADLLVERLRDSPAGDLSGLLDDASLLRMIGPFPLRRLLAMLGGVFSAQDLPVLIDQANAPRR